MFPEFLCHSKALNTFNLKDADPVSFEASETLTKTNPLDRSSRFFSGEIIRRQPEGDFLKISKGSFSWDLYKLSFFLLALFVTVVFCSGQAIAQGPPTGGEIKRIFSKEEMDQIKKEAQNAQSQGWRTTGIAKASEPKVQGHFFSATKIGLYLILFWLWVATTSWANNDAELLTDLSRPKWNRYLVTVFPIVFFLSLLVPFFFAGYPIAVIGFLVPIIGYVKHRNADRLEAEKVMTKDHIAFVLKRLSGAKIKQQKASYELGAPIRLESGGKGIDSETLNGRTILARNKPGFNPFREILYRSLKRNATSVVFDFNAETVNVQFELDGVWHKIEDAFKMPPTREEADGIAEAAKLLVGLNIADRRNRQHGLFHIKYDRNFKKKMDADITSQGTKTGEQIIIRYIVKKIQFSSFADLGMSKESEEKFRNFLRADKGLLILSALPGQGLKTMTDVAFNVADRFTRDFVTVEDAQNPYLPIENLLTQTYDSSKGETPVSVLPDVFFKEPKVLLLRDMVNKETLELCCEEVENDRLIVTTIRAKDAADTIMRVLSTGIDPKLFSERLIGVISQKLVRRLCPSCKEDIDPNPQILKHLGIKPGSVSDLYRKRVHPQLEPGEKDTYVPCPDCHEIGYIGRNGIYDILEVNEEIRQIIANNPSVEAIRKAAFASKQYGYILDGGKLVADGTTSFEELTRILK